MKKALKVILIVFLTFLIITLGFSLYVFFTTKSVRFDKNKFISAAPIVTYYDADGDVLSEETNGVDLAEIEDIPLHTKQAFISIEDKRFYKHKGVDYRGLTRAIVNNVKSFSFKEGASTISQQLIKNTHLTHEKTLKRKICEIKLAKELEKNYSKDEILQTYLNTIYFGDGCYGITSAAKHYFNKQPSELGINESAMLAGIIKAPSLYSPIVDKNKCNERKNLVLKEMFSQGYISKEDLNKNIDLEVEVKTEEKDSAYTLLSLARKQVNSIIETSPYSCSQLKVYTHLNKNLQQILEENLLLSDDASDKSGVIISSNGQIQAYYSTCGNVKRQMGSTFKPIAVYAPAIEMDVVSSITKILDEKTNFNGYSPSNYNDKYYGYVSVKDSLAKSLNTCAVKLLNYCGPEKSLAYASKMEIPISVNDYNLSAALGATENGATLTQLTAAYNVFSNLGYYPKTTIVEKITTDKDRIIYAENHKREKIFSEGTASILNDMLSYTVTDGTAKKLSFLDAPLYSKTGTVGYKDGNTDAYSISYNKDYTIGIWYGNMDNSLMPNCVSGGGVPTLSAAEVWKNIYKNSTPPQMIEKVGVSEIDIDNISYVDDNELILADNLSPDRYKIKALFKNSALPKLQSERFSNPKILAPEISLNNNAIEIRLCLTEYYDAQIYKEFNGIKEMVYDTNGNDKNVFLDFNIDPDTSYQYSVIPYFLSNDKKNYGQEILLKKIKSPRITPDDDWWLNDID